MTQPANRRILTYAAGDARYPAAASVLLKAVRGVAEGVASLGADGKVPASQLPPPASNTRATVLAATFTGSSTGADMATPLVMDNIPSNGVYLFDLEIATTGSTVGSAPATLIPPLVSLRLDSGAASVQMTVTNIAANHANNTPVATYVGFPATFTGREGNAPQVIQMKGLLSTTQLSRLGVWIRYNASTISPVVYAGSRFRLERIS